MAIDWSPVSPSTPKYPPKLPSPTSSRASHPRLSEEDATSAQSGTTPPSTAPPSVASYEHSCTFDADDWFSRFREDLYVSDDTPSPAVIEDAGDVPIYDATGNSRPFKSFISGVTAIGERQLVLFVRHFYCGACQAYLKALSQEITMQMYYTMPVPTSIIVIGCGSPALIPHYKAVTECPFPIFADPSRKLFKRLGMSWSLDIGSKRPEYMKEISPPAWLLEQIRQVSKTRGMKKFKGGNWLQIGGEFLFQNGQVIWCHRMKNYRGHAEIQVLKQLLEIES
ncbi:hypothetical protein H2203_003352 [Taxawa tesnikishii (nom. ined.)]|nr:hypothetical protein H2203_003352 [Dothideales sp. JES 119]